MKRKTLDLAVLAIWVSMLLSTNFSIDIPISLLGQFRGQFHGVLELAIYTLIYYGIAANESISSEFLINMILGCSVFVCGFAFTQIGTAENAGRVWGTFGSPIFLGSFLAISLPLAWTRARYKGKDELRGLFILLLGVVAVVASKARGAALGSAAGILVFEILSGNIKQAGYFGILSLAFLGLWHPFHKGSDLGRMEIYKAAWTAFKVNPIIGSGPDTFALLFRKYGPPWNIIVQSGGAWIQMSAHNDILQVLATMGIIGIAAYSFLLFNIFKQAYKNPVILAVFISIFIVAKFNPVHLVQISLCAALLGSTGEIYEPDKRWNIAICGFTLAALVVLVIARAQCRASLYEKLSDNLRSEGKLMPALGLSNMAATENPWEMYYVEREITQLWSMLPFLDPKLVSSISMITTNQAVKLHPNDANAHDLRALALKTVTIAGDGNTITESKAEMAEAMRLAPTFKDYTRDAGYIAAEMGNKDDEAKFKAALDSLEKFETQIK